jgi:ABC-type bacteriocin/lantibiotic exporter with double-glycine peptidase domain
LAAFRSYLRAVLPLLRPHWRRELEVLGYVLILMAYDRALPLGAKYLVDTVIPGRSLSQLAAFILVLLVIYVVSPIVGIRRAYVSARINQRILNDLQGKVFDSLQRLSHSFYGRSQVGDIALRLSNDLQSISEAVRQSADVAPYWSLSGLVTIVILLVLKPQLALAVLVTVPLAVAGILYFST